MNKEKDVFHSCRCRVTLVLLWLWMVYACNGQVTLVGAGEEALQRLNEAMAFGYKFVREDLSITYTNMSADRALRTYQRGQIDYVLSLSTLPGNGPTTADAGTMEDDWTLLFHGMVQVPIAASAFVPLLAQSHCSLESLALTCETLGQALLGRHSLSSLLQQSLSSRGDVCEFSNRTIRFKFVAPAFATPDQKESISRAVARCSPSFAAAWQAAHFGDLLGNHIYSPSLSTPDDTTFIQSNNQSSQQQTNEESPTLLIVNAWQLHQLASLPFILSLGLLSSLSPESTVVWYSGDAVARTLVHHSDAIANDSLMRPTRLGSSGGGIISGEPSRREWPFTCLVFANFQADYQGRRSILHGLHEDGDCSIIPEALRLVSWNVVNDQQEDNIADHGFLPLTKCYKALSAKISTKPLCRGQKAVPNLYIIGFATRAFYVFRAMATSFTYGTYTYNTKFILDSSKVAITDMSKQFDFASPDLRPSYASDPFEIYPPCTASPSPLRSSFSTPLSSSPDFALHPSSLACSPSPPAELLSIPIAVGAVVPVYNVPELYAQRPLTLSLQLVADVYTGAIRSWNHPRIQQLNPSHVLPNARIVLAFEPGSSAINLHLTMALCRIDNHFLNQIGVTDTLYKNNTHGEMVALYSIQDMEQRSYTLGFWTLDALKGTAHVSVADLVHPFFSWSSSSSASVDSITAALIAAEHTALVSKPLPQGQQAAQYKQSIEAFYANPNLTVFSAKQGILLAGDPMVHNSAQLVPWPLVYINYFLIERESSDDCDKAKAIADWIFWMETNVMTKQLAREGQMVIASTSGIISQYVMRQLVLNKCQGTHTLANSVCINAQGQICSEHGTCTATVCTCAHGYKGQQCQELDVPSDQHSGSSDGVIIGPVVGGTIFLVGIICALTGWLMFAAWRKRMRALYDFLIEPEQLTFIRKIAEGGYGEVWEATWRNSSVAAKLMGSEYRDKLHINADGKIVPMTMSSVSSIDHQTTTTTTMTKGGNPSGTLSKVVAIKRLYHLVKKCAGWRTLGRPNGPSSASKQEEEEQMISNEVRIMSLLRHPHVVLFMAAVIRPPYYILVMEYMMGGSLFDLLHNELLKELPLSLCVRLMRQTACGMSFLHQSGIAHRDLKSLNILLDDKGNAKVSDFGLTTMMQDTHAGSERRVAGSVQWAAPEVLCADDTHSYDPFVADVYSFGIVMWELLRREVPYRDMQLVAITMAVVRDDLRPEDLGAELPNDLGDLNRMDKVEALYEWLTANCWAANPVSRPTFCEIVSHLTEMSSELCNEFAVQQPAIDNQEQQEDSMHSSSDWAKSNSFLASIHAFEPPTNYVALVVFDVDNIDQLFDAPNGRQTIVVLFRDINVLLRQYDGFESMEPGVGTATSGSKVCVFRDAERSVHFAEKLCCLGPYTASTANLRQEPKLRQQQQMMDNSWKPLFKVGVDQGHCEAHVDMESGWAYYSGDLVQMAFELAHLAHPGQTLVSKAVHSALPLNMRRNIHVSRKNASMQPHNLTYTLQAESQQYQEVGEPNLFELEAPAFHDYTLLKKHYGFGKLARRPWAIKRVWLSEGMAQGTYDTRLGRARCSKLHGSQEVELIWPPVRYARMKDEKKIDLLMECETIYRMQSPFLHRFLGAAHPDQKDEALVLVYDARRQYTLEQLIEWAGENKREFNSDTVVAVLKDVVRGLECLHVSNVAHKGLTPASIVVFRDQDRGLRAKLADFGFDSLKTASTTMTTVEMPFWTAPEVIRGMRPGLPADIYALGVIMWQLLHGCKTPYATQNVTVLCTDVLHGKRPSLPGEGVLELNNDARTCYSRMITKCWQDSTESRPDIFKLGECYDRLRSMMTNGPHLATTAPADHFNPMAQHCV